MSEYLKLVDRILQLEREKSGDIGAHPTFRQTMEYMNASESTVKRLIEEGKLICMRFHGSKGPRRIDRRSIDAYLTERKIRFAYEEGIIDLTTYRKILGKKVEEMDSEPITAGQSD